MTLDDWKEKNRTKELEETIKKDILGYYSDEGDKDEYINDCVDDIMISMQRYKMERNENNKE